MSLRFIFIRKLEDGKGKEKSIVFDFLYAFFRERLNNKGYFRGRGLRDSS